MLAPTMRRYMYNVYVYTCVNDTEYMYTHRHTYKHATHAHVLVHYVWAVFCTEFKGGVEDLAGPAIAVPLFRVVRNAGAFFHRITEPCPYIL